MKKIILAVLLLAPFAFGQAAGSRYEVEILKNPNAGGKDTREVNAVIQFNEKSLRIYSRRKDSTFKEFQYSDIKYVEHSYSKQPFMSVATKSAVLTVLTGMPLFYSEKERHWLTVLCENDFVVLKIENDNFRLLKMEFMVRDLDVTNIDENRQ